MLPVRDALDHCAELVRAADRDRFIATLFAPAHLRGSLHALYAFNCEVARVREVARAPLPGEIRLQWWSDVIAGGRKEEALASPVASALLAAIERHHLPAVGFSELIEARRFDLYDEPMATLADLEAYAGKTSSALFALAVQILAGTEAEPLAASGGIAYAMAGLLRALPIHAARGQLYLPADVLERHNVRTHDVFAGRPSEALAAALAELRDVARRHLAAAHARIATLPAEALSAVLPLALVRPWLERLQRTDPFEVAQIPAWRRQWLIWGAARNPARLAA